jgi:hypothetical protein
VTGQCAAKPHGRSTSPLPKHADFLLALIEVEPDLTLNEVVCAMPKHKIADSRTAVWRFFQRREVAWAYWLMVAFKKACARRSRSARKWRGRVDVGCENKA